MSIKEQEIAAHLVGVDLSGRSYVMVGAVTQNLQRDLHGPNHGDGIHENRSCAI